MSDLITGLTYWGIPVLLAVTLHEAAHGYAAKLFGDTTAERMGRLSLNPIRHVDPFGTVLLPLILYFGGGMLFGYAKPVPVQFGALKPRRLGTAIVALAGPATNILLSILSIVLYLHVAGYLPEAATAWAKASLVASFQLNVTLAAFNLLPIPPLDGSRVIAALLPRPLAARFWQLDRFGFLIVFGLLFLLPMLGDQLGQNWHFLQEVVTVPAYWLRRLLVVVFA